MNDVLLALNRIIEQAMLAQATTPEGQAHRCLHDIEETARKTFASITRPALSVLCSCRCHDDDAESCNCGCCGRCPR